MCMLSRQGYIVGSLQGEHKGQFAARTANMNRPYCSLTATAQSLVRCTDGKHETALLLFDGHSTHLTLQAIQEAEMQGQRSGGRRHQAIGRRRARPRGAFCPGPGPGPCPLSLSRSLPALPVPALAFLF